MQGTFISFEGVDGVGKTTQVERLRAYVESQGRECVVTREPGGTALGVAIRKMLLHGVDTGDENDCADIAPRTEALLFAADRAQHVAEVILPALQRGAVVITDRYLDSSLAYQAGGRELTAAEIRNLSMWATNGLLPERTYLLDMDPAQSHARLQHAEDRMELPATTSSVAHASRSSTWLNVSRNGSTSLTQASPSKTCGRVSKPISTP